MTRGRAHHRGGIFPSGEIVSDTSHGSERMNPSTGGRALGLVEMDGFGEAVHGLGGEGGDFDDDVADAQGGVGA